MKLEDLISLFVKELPRERFLTAQNDLDYYGKDACKDFTASPALIFLPHSKEEVSTFLALCNANSIAVVPSGGRTGYSGGATAYNGEVVLSLEKMNKILSVSVDAQTITCQAGVTTQAVIDAASRHGLFYGVDFASKGSSHIGGNVSTNAGGIRVIRHGNTREWVLGVTVVLADGSIETFNGELVKNQTGYDLRHLCVGSEGTLGVVVEVTLKLSSKPLESALALCGLSNPAKAVTILGLLKKEKFTVNVIEYFDALCHDLVTSKMGVRTPFAATYPSYVVIEVELGRRTREDFESFLVSHAENGIIADVVVAQGETQAAELMALRERISECTAKHFTVHKNDISIPVRCIAPFIEEFHATLRKQHATLRSLVFGHIGDGNLHIHLLKEENASPEEFFTRCHGYDAATFQIVSKYNGSISAEHGVGLLKKEFLRCSRSAREIELMKGIKRVFDPNGILNPGKIFDL